MFVRVTDLAGLGQESAKAALVAQVANLNQAIAAAAGAGDPTGALPGLNTQLAVLQSQIAALGQPPKLGLVDRVKGLSNMQKAGAGLGVLAAIAGASWVAKNQGWV